MRKLRTLSGIIILIIDCFIWYYRSDIITELISGRPIIEIDISQLILPILLLVIGVFLIFKKKTNEKQKMDS